MFEITYHNNEIIISSDIPFVPALKSFLISNGFVVTEATRGIVKSNDPYDTIVTTQNMVEMYDRCTLDSECKRILQDRIKFKQEFQKLVANVEKLKNHEKKYWKKTHISIPQMQPNASLKWYQKMPVIHAVMLGNSANFSVPGSGKTWMGYSTFLKLKYEKNEIDKLLIVAPLVAFRPWEIEYKTMTKREPSCIRIIGTQDDRKHLFYYEIPKSNADIFLISQTMVAKEIVQLTKMLKTSRFMIILDESHNIKRHTSKRAIALHQIAPYAKKRMILTGTPMPKSIHDLWSQFTFLYPDHSLLHKWVRYEQVCKEPNAIKNISNLTRPYFVRISKNMLDLPNPSFNPDNPNGMPTVIPMGTIQRRIYDAIAMKIRENVDQFRHDVVAMEKFRKNSMIYLIEAATDPSLLTKDTTYQGNDVDVEGLDILDLLGKYPRLRNENLNKLEYARRLAMNTLDAGKKVVIWCSFINTIKKLSEYMNDVGHKSVMIWGNIPRDEEINPVFNRELEIEKFKTDANYNILIANPSTLAESISLHRHCHHAIYVDRTFNGAHYMQSLERIHRVGLDPNVVTRYDILQSEHSIDQTIHDRLITKQTNMERFLNNEELKVYATTDDEDDPSMTISDDEQEDDFDAVLRDIDKHDGNI